MSNINDKMWFKNFEEFKEHVNKTGSFPKDRSPLYNWYFTNRDKYNRGTLNENRYNALIEEFPYYFEVGVAGFKRRIAENRDKSGDGEFGKYSHIDSIIKDNDILANAISYGYLTVDDFIKDLVSGSRYANDIVMKLGINVYDLVKDAYFKDRVMPAEWSLEVLRCVNGSPKYGSYDLLIFSNEGFSENFERDLEKTIDKYLSYRQIDYIYRKYKLGRSLRQIGEEEGITANSVCRVIYSGFRKLKLLESHFMYYQYYRGKWMCEMDYLVSRTREGKFNFMELPLNRSGFIFSNSVLRDLKRMGCETVGGVYNKSSKYMGTICKREVDSFKEYINGILGENGYEK